MGAFSTISSKGQITVPIEVRRCLGVKQGDRVESVEEDGKTVLRPTRSSVNAFEEFVGCLPVFRNIEELNAWIRDMRDHDGETQSAN